VQQTKNLMISIATKDLYKERISICKSCEHYSKLTMQCKVCKCFMFVKAKIVDTNCPLEKWVNPKGQWGSNFL